MRPIAIDLFCGAGGASMGLHRAGFDVRGIDIKPQPEYPFPMTVGDALEADLTGADFVWASPPCQAYSLATGKYRSKHPDLVPATRAKLEGWGGVWAMENVVGAPLRNPVLLCGAMFGLGTIRHRLFELSWFEFAPSHPVHVGSVVTGEYITIAGNSGVPSWTRKQRALRGLAMSFPGEYRKASWAKAMGIDWMKRKTLTQAIPPAYGEWVGKRAMKELERRCVGVG